MEYFDSSFRFLSLQRVQHKQILPVRGAANVAGPYAMQEAFLCYLVAKDKKSQNLFKSFATYQYNRTEELYD